MMKQIGNIQIDYQRLAEAFAIATGNINTNSVSVEQFSDEYEKFIERNRSKAYLSSVSLSFDHLLKYFSPARMVNSISFKDAEAFMSDLLKRCPKGCYVYYRTLKAAFNKGVEWNYLHTNPFIKIKLVKTQSAAPKYLTNEEFERVMLKVENKLIEDFCRVAFDTGMRLSELVYLRWKNADLIKKVIVVGDEVFTTKSRRQRIVPMSGKVFLILEARYRLVGGKDTPLPLSRGDFIKQYVFGKSFSKPYTGDYFSKKFKEACRAAEIDEGIHLHSLRHSAATRMAQSGAPIIAVKEILGHSSISTTMIYAHTDLEAMRAAVNLLK